MTASRIAELLHKPRAVAELASELSLGDESLLFIDDNPAECAAVRAALPHVPCWCWPQEAAEARMQLDHFWPLDVAGRAAATTDDARRAASYAAEAPRRALRARAASLQAYLEALELRIRFTTLDEERDAERLIQLRERTNQFNSWRRPLPFTGLRGFVGVGTARPWGSNPCTE